MSSPFPLFPKLKQEADTERGLAKLVEVHETSDGFAVGFALFYDDEGNHVDSHSVFLGAASDYR